MPRPANSCSVVERLVEVPVRVRPDREPAGGVDDVDRLGHRRPRAPHVAGRAGDEVGGEERVAALDPFVAQPRARWPGARAARRRGAGGRARRARLQRRVVELEAELAQPVGHREDAAHAVGAEVLQRVEQRAVGVVERVAEDVQVLVSAVHRRELGRGHECDVLNIGRGERLGHAVD